MNIKNLLVWCIFLGLLSGIIFVGYLLFNNDTYEVKFDVMGGSTVDAIEIKSDKTLNELPTTTKKGYEFAGWYESDEPFNVDIPITKDITLNAKWILKEDKEYTLKFDSLGGNDINDIKIKENTILSDIPEPIKEGYTFKGWFYHNKEFDFTKPITDNYILIAKWSKSIDE